MRVFVTGATGHIGSAVVRELIQAGHQPIGLARSDTGAGALRKAGAEVHMGSLEDIDSLRRAAADADGVIHMAFIHDFSNFGASLQIDLRAIEAMGSAIEGTNKPFLITAHMNGEASEKKLFSFPGVRSVVVSLPPTVHGGEDKHGFVPSLIAIARAKGVSAYVGDGTNRWPAVHELDAAVLYRLALEKAPAGSKLFGRAEQGVCFKDIAGTIGRHLNVPAVSISREEADGHFGFLGVLASADISGMSPASSEQARDLLGWRPAHPTLLEDLEEGYYFDIEA